jgi:hypothetical protein
LVRFATLPVLVVCMAAGTSVKAQASEPASPISGGQGWARAELTTRAGDHLTGRVLRLDCHGLRFQYFGNTLRVPLQQITALTSGGEVPVLPGGGKDQIIGNLMVKAATVSVTSREVGTVVLPIAAFRCNDNAPLDAAAGGKGIRQASTAPPTAADNQLTTAIASQRKLAELEPSARELAGISGKGAESTGENQVDQGAGATSPPSAPQTDQKGSPEAAPATQQDHSKPPDDNSSNQSNGVGTPAATASSPTPKEQQEESERNTLEFLRNEVVLVQPQKIETDFSVAYLHTSEEIGNERVVIGSATGRYGFFPGFEGFLAIPYIWGQRQTIGPSTYIGTEEAGIGDIAFGLKDNILQEKQYIPVVVVGASAVAPTGHNPYLAPSILTPTTTSITSTTSPTSTTSTTVAQAGDTRNPLNIQLGTGHWQVQGSLTALKSNDPLVLYGSINYTHFIPATYYSVHIVPGDVWELNSGFGFAVNDTSTISAQVFIDYVKKWTFNDVAVPQTGITPINLKLSYTYVLSPVDLIQPSLTFGVTRDATDAVVALDYIHRF